MYSFLISCALWIAYVISREEERCKDKAIFNPLVGAKDSKIRHHEESIALFLKRAFIKCPILRDSPALYPDNVLNRQFKPGSVNKVWASDTSFIPSRKCWVYLCVVMDLFSRKIVGWSLGSRHDSSLVESALRRSVELRGYRKGIMFHSDRGTEYSSTQVHDFLKKYKMIASMSRKGNCWDNAPVESFFKTFKQEFIPRIKPEKLDLEEIRSECSKYMLEYNTKRIHSSLDRKSPSEYEREGFH